MNARPEPTRPPRTGRMVCRTCGAPLIVALNQRDHRLKFDREPVGYGGRWVVGREEIGVFGAYVPVRPAVWRCRPATEEERTAVLPLFTYSGPTVQLWRLHSCAGPR